MLTGVLLAELWRPSTLWAVRICASIACIRPLNASCMLRRPAAACLTALRSGAPWSQRPQTALLHALQMKGRLSYWASYKRATFLRPLRSAREHVWPCVVPNHVCMFAGT